MITFILSAQSVYLCKRDKRGWCQVSTSPAANGGHSSLCLTEYTCTNVHTHSGSFHDNKDLSVGAATYLQCEEAILNSSSLKCKFTIYSTHVHMSCQKIPYWC